jgi:hypothetical protein
MNTIEYGQGAVNNTIGWGQGAKVGSSFSNTKSIELDGVDDFVSLGTASSLEFTSDFSISAWIKDIGNLNRGIICCSNRSASNGWQMQRTSTNKVSFYSGARTATSTTSINTGAWFHVLATWEKDTPSEPSFGNRVRIYVNGVLEGTSTRVSTSAPTYTGTIVKEIGFPYGGTNYYRGHIDEVAAFDKLLTSSEISNIYNGGVPNDIASLSPVSWWRFEGTGTTATDSGSGGNNGTLENSAARTTDVPT